MQRTANQTMLLTVQPQARREWVVTADMAADGVPFAEKAVATDYARVMGECLAPATVQVRGADGRIEAEWTFGNAVPMRAAA